MIVVRRCPFCGSDAIVEHDRYRDYVIQCTNENCHACYRDETHQKVVETWNRRVS